MTTASVSDAERDRERDKAPAARVLGPVPRPLVRHGRAEPGSYEGSLGPLDFTSAASVWTRIKRLKRWVYIGLATDRFFVGLASVRLGYAASAFAFVFDKLRGRFVMDEKLVLPVTAVEIEDTTGEGARARFSFGKNRMSVERARGRDAFVVSAAFRGLRLDAELDASRAPSAISAVATTEGGLFTTTEKRLLLSVKGEIEVGGERVSLDGGLAAYDYTGGFMPRHTQWKWAFALGKVEGEPFGLNLVEGFVKEAECAAWYDGKLWPLSEGDLRLVPGKPLEPWTVRTKSGEVDLEFSPAGMHEDATNLGLVRARFVQPAGLYTGSVRLGERTLDLTDVLGVTEDQSVLW